jgi:hypothetical protein
MVMGAGAAGLLATMCSAPGKGGLVLALSTDMQAPKDINVVSLYVDTDGVPKFDYLGRVLPDGSVSLPSTLALVEPDDPHAQVRIRVTAFVTQPDGSAKARVTRDVLTTVPHQRIGLLRIPLSFLDDGSAQGTIPPSLVPDRQRGIAEGPTSYSPTDPVPTDPGYLTTTCDFSQGQTSVAGSCASAQIDSSKTPDYADDLVYGADGSPGNVQCFPVDACLKAAGAPMTMQDVQMNPTDGSCSFPVPAGETGQNWNCALETTDMTGRCVGPNGAPPCLVPLESDPGEGFAFDMAQQRVVMVPGVCKRLAAGAKLWVDKQSCATKVEATPVCQAGMASAGDAGAIADATVGPDTGADASPEAMALHDGATDATLDAKGDAPADAAGDASFEAAVDASTGYVVYVDPTAGSDTNPGTAGQPLKTLGQAATLVNGPDGGAGATVNLAAGTYPSPGTLWATFNRPTFVVGAGSGSVVLSGANNGEEIYFLAGGGVSGVTFHNTGYSFRCDSGNFTVSDVVLDGVGYGPYLIGNTVATIDTMTIVNLPDAGGNDWACLRTANTASVTWHATGTTVTSGSVAHADCVLIDDTSQVAIDGLTMTNFVGTGAHVSSNGALLLASSTFTNVSAAVGVNAVQSQNCSGSIMIDAANGSVPGYSLTLSGSTITSSPGAAVCYLANNGTGAVSLDFANSHLDGNTYAGLWMWGIYTPIGPLQVTSSATTFSNNGIAGFTSYLPVSVSITGGALSGNGATAMDLASLGQAPGGLVLGTTLGANALTLRSATFASNTGNAISLGGSAGTTADLGTVSTPGGSTFSGIPMGSSAFNMTATSMVNAIGNTWMPAVQGADANGNYTAATTLMGPQTGQNVTIPSGASVVLE